MMNECSIAHVLSCIGKLILRLTIAVAIWPHGAQKLLGLFGGAGFSATLKDFTDGMGIWAPMAVIAILTEFFAPFFLVTGLLTRFAALALTILMFVAMTVHWGNGFFINWGNQPNMPEGIEYHLLFIGACVSLMLTGPGRYSLDYLLMHRFCSKRHCSCGSR